MFVSVSWQQHHTEEAARYVLHFLFFIEGSVHVNDKKKFFFHSPEVNDGM